MGGIVGEVACMTTNSTHMFLGVETSKKSGSRGMALYRQPLSLVVGMDENITLGSSICLEQNFPNPFSNSTTINFKIENTSIACIIIYNQQGSVVYQSIPKTYKSGSHSIVVELGAMALGLYYYALKTEQGLQFRKMVLLK